MAELATLALGWSAARIDWQRRILPDQYTFLIYVLGAVAWTPTANAALLWLCIVVFHIGLVLLPQAGLGGGDAKLVAGLAFAAVAGNWWWLWLWFTYTTATIHGLVQRRRGDRSGIPLGVWLMAAWTACAVGQLTHVALANRR